MTTIRTTCPYCGVGCGMLATPDGRGGVAVAGDPAHPANLGRLCSKGAALGETIALDGRLLAPRIHGRDAGWDEALDRIVSGFTDATARHGSEAAWVFSSAGTMGLVHRDGVFRLRHAMRWSGRKGTICSTIATVGWTAGCGRVTGSDSR